jgi:2-dehydro-3-deoxygalactonokinase
LRNGIEKLFVAVLQKGHLEPSDISYVLCSGMITSEIGLIEIPHLVAPVSLEDLASNVRICEDESVLSLHVPLVFVPGIRNNYGDDITLDKIREVDFMRGEEVQCVGMIDTLGLRLPINIVVLSSHTKIIHVNEQKQICGCITTLSGQLYGAILKETSVGKSLHPDASQKAGGYTQEQIKAIACESVKHAGLNRSLLMPRFMEVLLRTSGEERMLFLDAAIAADDLNAFHEMENLGFSGSECLLVGKEGRCETYKSLLEDEFPDMHVSYVSKVEEIDRFTISGVLAVAKAAGLQI